MSTDVDPHHVTATDLAATAVIGALLWDPRRARDVEWLHPDDFAHPTHHALYATIQGMQRDGRPVDARNILGPLAAGEYHEFAEMVRGSPGALVHDMLAATPATPSLETMTANGAPVARSEHVRYARLVLDDSIRREITAAGVRIGQTSAAATSLDHESAAEDIVAELQQTIARLETTLDRHHRSQGAGSITTRHEAVTSASATHRSGDGATRGPLSRRQVARAERRVIGACLVDPSTRTAAIAQLRPEDFTPGAAEQTWAALTGLSGSGGPVDYVFLAVELERRGDGQRRIGMTPDQLRELATRPDAAAVGRDLDTVARAALLRTALRTQAALKDVAGHDPRRAGEALAAAQTALQLARNAAQRVGGGSTLQIARALSAPPGIPAQQQARPLGSSATPAPRRLDAPPAATGPDHSRGSGPRR